jgi:peroxiredoxin
MKHPLRLTGALAVLALSLGGCAADVRADVEKHKALLGKPAPDFQADFAVNGKPVKLADLKGKVVLLTFWVPSQASSRSAMLRLQEWHKEYYEKGLEILAVSRYNSDYGRAFTFDMERGTVVKAETATRETDKQLLRDFATYHKLEFRLLALPREQADPLYKDVYGVSSVPQFVVIDRRGRVRLIRVGASQKQYEAVDEEIRKLLEERK